MSHVLITGANSGFGRLTVEELVKAGHKVTASMRDSEGRNRTTCEALTQVGVHVVEIDVTQEESVTKGVQQALERQGSIEVLVNNAGIGVLGFQECFTPEDWKRLFEINVFGVQRMIRAVVPQMKQQGYGLLLQVSSLLGRMVLPFYGPYNASKWAVEALAENYRVELAPLGIESCVLEPGGFPTSFIERLLKPSDPARAQTYGEMSEMPQGFLAGFEKVLAANPVQDPRLVALAITELISKPRGERPFRTIVDKLGMGDALQDYNAHQERVTSGIYAAFGLGHLLQLRK